MHACCVDQSHYSVSSRVCCCLLQAPKREVQEVANVLLKWNNFLQQVYYHYSGLGANETDSVFTMSLQQVGACCVRALSLICIYEDFVRVGDFMIVDVVIVIRSCLCMQMWTLCQTCKLLDQNVTLADVNRMLQLLRSRHANAVVMAATKRTNPPPAPV